MTPDEALAKLGRGAPFSIDRLMQITQWTYNQAARQIEMWRRRSLVISVNDDQCAEYRALSGEDIVNL